MGRVLGIDYGEKRIGLALTDPMRIIASPFETLVRSDLASDLDELAGIIAEQEVEEIVLGSPCNTDGSRGEMVRRVEEFAAKVRERVGLPIHYVDETYTSLEADEILRLEHRDWRKRKAKKDMVAAQIILRTWLESPERT